MCVRVAGSVYVCVWLPAYVWQVLPMCAHRQVVPSMCVCACGRYCLCVWQVLPNIHSPCLSKKMREDADCRDVCVCVRGGGCVGWGVGGLVDGCGRVCECLAC